MRKIVAVIILFLLFNIKMTFKNNIDLVFNENNNSYNTYCIDVTKLNITTRNLNNYFKSDVIGISAKINDLYESKFNNLDLYYNIDNNNDSLIKYEKYIANILFNKGYKNDYYRISINGLKIKYVYLYTNIDNINSIINKYNITYKVIYGT